jgi:protein O-GlcNAc transferase
MNKKTRFDVGGGRAGISRNQPASRNAPSAPSFDVAATLKQAVAFHQAGLLAEAESLYRKVLQIQPTNFDCLHLLGVIQYQNGQHLSALRQIDAALVINPKFAAAYNSRGVALFALKRFVDAATSYSKAIALSPDYIDALYNRGNAQKELGQFEDALASYDRALALKPDYVDALNGRGNALKALKQFDQALESYGRAIAINPRCVDAIYNRGNALVDMHRHEEALAEYEKAIALRGAFAEALHARGNALKQLKRFEEALASYDRAIAIRPNYADVWSNRGIVLAALKRLEDARESYDRTIALEPERAEALYNRGLVLADLGRFEEALASYDRAIALKPDRAEVFYSRGLVLLHLKRPEAALASYDRAFALDPDMDLLSGIRLHTKMYLCDWADFAGECERLLGAVRRGAVACYPFQLLACPARAQDQLTCARAHADKCAAPEAPLWQGERYGHKRIRIAYLSSDFRDHPVTHLTAGLFEQHDRARFETFAVAFRPDLQDALGERLKRSFDRFIDAQTMSDEDVARFLREQEIDITVDLNGVTDGSRPHIFAHKPAPIQVNYLGYAGTLGRSYCDYIIADRFVIPENAREHYVEKVVYLPDSFMASDDKRRVSERTPSREEAGLPSHGLVCCCFNGSFKITPDVFDVWMRLLREVHGSVLWLPAFGGVATDNLRREAEQRGVSADRLVFAPKTLRNEDHLARLRLADLFLDTLYYNAHTTANDALWVGVPVLTCAGETFASRVAGSLLRAVGLPELIAHSPSEYEALALKLARDPNLLSEVKHKLARERATHPLFNTARFTRHIEAAYVGMWERAECGEPPQSFATDPIEAR